MSIMEGGLPLKVYKGYVDPKHASDLVECGRIRLGILDIYRQIESESRRDHSEGEAKLKILSDVKTIHIDSQTLKKIDETVAPGYLNFSSTSLNPCYVFCVAGPDVSYNHLQTKFGDSVVEIFDTNTFLIEFEKSLIKHPLYGRKVLSLGSYQIRYDKGEVGNYPSQDGDKINYTQKSPGFKADCEWRVVAEISGLREGVPDEIFLNLSGPTQFCKIVNS